MDGFRVMPMEEAALVGDFFVTVTGNLKVIRGEHFAAMKDGAIVCNSGHFNVELDIPALEKLSRKKRAHPTGRGAIHAEDRPSGQPARRRPAREPGDRRRPPLQRHGHELRQPGARRGVHGEELQEAGEEGLSGPAVIDKEIARLKLAGMGMKIDTLTKEQVKYLASLGDGHVRNGAARGGPRARRARTIKLCSFDARSSEHLHPLLSGYRLGKKKGRLCRRPFCFLRAHSADLSRIAR